MMLCLDSLLVFMTTIQESGEEEQDLGKGRVQHYIDQVIQGSDSKSSEPHVNAGIHTLCHSLHLPAPLPSHSQFALKDTPSHPFLSFLLHKSGCKGRC